MYSAVLEDGWDGEWFIRAYDAQSQKIGSKECKEGQIFHRTAGLLRPRRSRHRRGAAQSAH